MENQAVPQTANQKIWSGAIGGVIIILILHLLVTIVSSGIIEMVTKAKSIPNPVPLLLNFFISKWFIKNQTKPEWKITKKPFLYGLLVSGALLMIAAIFETVYIVWLHYNA